MKDNPLTREARLSAWLLGSFCTSAAAATLIAILDAIAVGSPFLDALFQDDSFQESLFQESLFQKSWIQGFWFQETGPLQQGLGLVHFATGAIFSALLAVYTVHHFLRTLGMRKPLLLFTGLTAAALMFALAASGWHLGLAGQRENQRWIYFLHYGLGFAVLALVALHVFCHYALKKESLKKEGLKKEGLKKEVLKKEDLRKEGLNNELGNKEQLKKESPIKENAGKDAARIKANPQKIFNTLDGLPLSVFAAAIAGATILLSVMGLTRITTPEPAAGPAVEDYRYDYGSHPFRPSQTESQHGGFVAERDIANAGACAGCHREIAAQWAASAHRHAADDIAYASSIDLLIEKEGIEATRYCEGCHTPVALLTGELSPGGRHGAVAGTAGNAEGVGCVSCHRITEVLHTKGVASYEFTPASPYLFAYAESYFFRQLNRFLIRAMPRRHRREMAPGALSDPKHCATCHTQFMDKDMNGWGWIKMQDEYSAWLESPYAAQHEQRFANADLKRCQDCHMPLVKASDPSANSDGLVRDHRFPGANTMLPTLNGDREQLAHITRFLQNNKMRISIERPYRADATQNRQALDQRLRSTPIKPWYFYKGEEAKIDVIVSNTGVGHDFPGGTIDINQAWIHFRVSDAEGNPIFESGRMDADHKVDPDAYFYRSLPVDRGGQLIWRHNLFDMIGEVSRNTIKAGESDAVEYRFEVPPWAKGPLFVSSSLLYRKFNDRYARWALKDKYTPLPVTEMARAFLTIPIREQVEARPRETRVVRSRPVSF